MPNNTNCPADRWLLRVSGLVACGLDVHVITRKSVTPCPEYELVDGVHVRRLSPAGISKGTGWRAMPQVLAYLARLALLLIAEAPRYDILIVSGMKIIPLVAVPIALLFGKRCIIRLESAGEINEPLSKETLRHINKGMSWIMQSLLTRMQRSMLLRADRVVAISDFLHRSLLAVGVSESRISRIPNAIDLRRFHPVSIKQRDCLRAELGLPAHATLVLFAARLSRAKGIDLLVDTWPDIIARHPELCLIIAGSGDTSFDSCEMELAASIRQCGLGSERIRLVGATDHVEHYLQAADLYILPSDHEGFGIGIVEALAAGRPCLLTPVGIVQQLIRDGMNGFLFPPRDRGAMIQAIDTALSARDRWMEIGERGRLSVLGLDLPSIVQTYAALCMDLARGMRPRQ